MVKKAKAKVAKKNAKMKKGSKYVCDACGMVVTVEEPCTCDPCEGISCCGEEMRAVCSC